MNNIKKAALLIAAITIPNMGAADHHEKGNTMMPAASSGQLVLVYHWPCADMNAGMAKLKSMIAYERDASPHPYSAAPAIHEDGALASIDVHSSTKSMEQAVAWQESDEKWQALLADLAEACGSADDLTVKTLSVQ